VRDTTKIRALAQETVDDLSKLDQTEDVKNAVENQKEIIRIASKMDARTGTVDPSAKVSRPQPKPGS
jgi:hypothetical protein